LLVKKSFSLCYFTADDDGVTAKVKAAGRGDDGATDMPEVGGITVLTDPQGAAFGVIREI
jgi:predicted enzyme related to lactoylglutathione lyase